MPATKHNKTKSSDNPNSIVTSFMRLCSKHKNKINYMIIILIRFINCPSHKLAPEKAQTDKKEGRGKEQCVFGGWGGCLKVYTIFINSVSEKQYPLL